MHPFQWTPLITLLGSCVVGSASVARDLAYRPNRVVAGIMVCTGGWALLEIAWSLQDDAATALQLCRLLGFVYLPLAPLVLELLFQLDLFQGRGFPRLRIPLWTLTGLLVLAHAGTPWFIAEVVPSSHGWRYVFGPAFWPGLVATVAGCAMAALCLMRVSTPRVRRKRQLRWLGGVIWVPIVAACVTDVGLPAAGIDGPRLGAASIALATGSLWLGMLASGNPDLASGTLARQFLDRLPDGVAILRGDGLLRSANERLATILHSEPDALLGVPADRAIPGIADAPPGSVRELQIETRDGPVAVAVWDSEILDRQGTPIGRVVVVRDQHALVELRGRLMGAGQMAAMGELAAGIAHEVNNPLAYVIANLNQLRRVLQEVSKGLPDARVRIERVAQAVDESLASLERMVDFVGQVRSLAYPGGGPRVACDVNEVVAGVVRLAAPKLGADRRVDLDFLGSPEARCAPPELKHALLSILLGIASEMQAGERVRIRTRASAGAARIEFELDRQLAAETLVDETELLWSSSLGARSTGLLVPRHILRQQGGQLRVEATAASGTRVSVRVPGGERS